MPWRIPSAREPPYVPATHRFQHRSLSAVPPKRSPIQIAPEQVASESGDVVALSDEHAAAGDQPDPKTHRSEPWTRHRASVSPPNLNRTLRGASMHVCDAPPS